MQKSARVLSLCLLLALVLSLGMPAAFAEGTEPEPEKIEEPVTTPVQKVSEPEKAAPLVECVHVRTKRVVDVPGNCVTEQIVHMECRCGQNKGEAYSEGKRPGNHVGGTYAVNEIGNLNIDLMHATYCSSCNAYLGSENHHSVEIEAVAPTCTTDGHTAGSQCADCGKVFVASEVIPATGHTEVVDKAVAATCTESGSTEGSHCSVCGEVLVAQEIIPATGHKWEYQSIDDKQHTSKCTVCGEEQTENHILVEKERVEATCTENGSYEMDCTLCNYSKDYVIKATGHTEETIPGKAATCTETGLTEGKKCSVCGETLVAQEIIPALGHKLATENGKAPTCEEAGTTDKDVCARCGEVLREAEIIPATGHDWGDWKDNGNGTHTRTCKNDASHTQTENHNVVEIASVPATCTTPGASGGKWCSDCHAIIEAPKIIPATGHDWGAWANTGDGKTHVRVCANDPSHTEYQQHKMGPWETVKYNTETTDGYRQRWCLAPDCDYHETQVIKAGAPKTGDSSNIMLYSGLCLAAVCGTAGVLVYVKRKKAE